MPQCAVATCRNSHRKTKGRRVRYHRFPAEESVRERWVAVCGRSTIFNTTTARVCSLHFSAPSYERDVEHELLGLPPRSRLRRGAVPDLYVPISVPSLIKKFNSCPPPPRVRHVAPHNGGIKNHPLMHHNKLPNSGNKLAAKKHHVGFGVPRGGVSTLMTPPSAREHSPVGSEESLEVLLALGLVPRNNNNGHFWEDHHLSGLSGMPVTEGAGGDSPPHIKVQQAPRARAPSMDSAPPGQVNGSRPSEGCEEGEGASEGEQVARAAAAAALVSVNIAEGSPLVFGRDGAPVKDEPGEGSSGCGSDEEGSPPSTATPSHTPQLALKRRGEELGASGGKRARSMDVGTSHYEAATLLEEEGEGDRERLVRSFVDAASCEGAEEAARCAEMLRGELGMLRALAEAKEREWNQVIRLRALKEEMLVRLERRRAVLSMHGGSRGGAGSSGAGGSRQRPILPKPPTLNGAAAQNSVIGEGRQGPILDVRSIIADYRSRHPEAVPRRGRRLKPGAGGGRGSPNPGELSELGSLLSEALNRPHHQPADTSRPSSADSSRSGVPQAEPPISFKDVLVKFAKMSQSEGASHGSGSSSGRLPYPEVTLHPVPPAVSPAPALGPASSLLQGILSKPGGGAPGGPKATNFSPTLARLLTAPERPSQGSAAVVTANVSQAVPPVSISDLLGPTKQGRTEITITPVASQLAKARAAAKASEAHLEGESPGDEEEDGGEDRLVIDERQQQTKQQQQQQQQARSRAPQQARLQRPPASKGAPVPTRTSEEDEDEEEEAPECQGCHRQQAQFVCAGCGNQWYCSRECQVAAWDDHSEVCSG